MKQETDRSREVVAVVDCGSSAVRTYIAEVGATGTRLLDDAAVPVDLVRCLDEGRLDRTAIDELSEAMQLVAQLTRDYGVQSLRAVGTSLLREVSNRDVVLERVRRQCGIELEAIDAAEEARLYYEALVAMARRERLPLRGRALLADIGSSSTITSVISGSKLIHSVDEHFGTVRTSQEFAYLHDSYHYVPTVDRLAAGAVQMIMRRLSVRGCRRLLVTGKEVRPLAEHLVGGGEDATTITLPVRRVAEWVQRHRGLTRDSADALGLDEPLLVVPAAVMLVHLARVLEIEEILVPRLNLRDGLLADALPGADGPHHLKRNQLLAEAKSISTRFRMDRTYAANTAALAVQLFDQTRALHRLGERESCLLEFAAWVHDVGAFVNVRNRHKHTLYLIQSSDIAGLSSSEKAVVANVARYHRRASPSMKHPDFAALPRAERVVVGYLAALLRLAYGLDVDREQRIRKVSCSLHEGRMLLRVERRRVELERWSLREKSDLFREVFGLAVDVVPRKDD